MRSEGFPFMVGVWGWTCVRVVLVVSSSCRLRCVVNVSPYGAVHTHCDTILSFKVWKVEEVSYEMFVLALPSHKMGGRFRSFAWQAQYYWKRVNASVSFFCGRRSTLWCGLSRWRGRRSILSRGESPFFMNRLVTVAQTWHSVKSRGRRRIWWVSWKVAEAVQKSYLLSSVKIASKEKLAWNRRFSSWKCGIWRKSRTKCSFWRFKLSRWEVIFAFCVAGARFWKLLAWKIEEASHEMLVLEAFCFKSWGNFARNARSESPLASTAWGCLARNARFRRFLPEQLT